MDNVQSSCCINEIENHYGNCDERPDLYGILIRGKRGRLLAKLYTAAGDGYHPVVLLLHGIPGTEQNIDLAQELRRGGFHVITFHYSGSWGSDGDYSLSHNLEDANTVLDYVLNADEFCFDTGRIFAVGHSLGGFVCGQLTAHRPEIKAGVMLMPCDIGRINEIRQNDPKGYREITEVLEESSHWLHGTSGDALREEAEAHADEYSLVSVAPLLAAKPTLFCTGSLDYVTPDESFCKPIRDAIINAGGSNVRHISYPTDHFFSDYRLTIASAVTGFLQGQLTTI